MLLAVNWRTTDALNGLIEPNSLRKITLFRHMAALQKLLCITSFENYLFIRFP